MPGFAINNGHVVYLSLANVDLLDFPLDILKLSKLQYLSLYNTKTISLSDEIENLQDLEMFSFSNNNYLKMVPKTLTNLTKLKELRVIQTGIDREFLPNMVQKNCDVKFL